MTEIEDEAMSLSPSTDSPAKETNTLSIADELHTAINGKPNDSVADNMGDFFRNEKFEDVNEESVPPLPLGPNIDIEHVRVLR